MVNCCLCVSGSTAPSAPSLRGLAKIGSSEPIFVWGSVLKWIRHSLRHAVRRATSLKEGGKAATLHDTVNNNIYLVSKIPPQSV